MIIGGGIVGSSIYLLLKKLGINTVLIDPNIRKIFPSLIHSLLLKGKDIELARLSLDFYRMFRIPYIPFKSYTIGDIDSRLLNLWSSVGVNINQKFVNWLDSDAIEAVGGDGLVYIKNLLSKAERIIKYARVIIDKNKEGIVKIENTTYEPDLIILSAGAWSKYLVNIKIPIKTYYCWASLIISNRKEIGSNIIYDYVNYFYSRPVMGLGLPFAIAGDGKTIEANPYERKICIDDKREVILRISKRFGYVKDLYTSGSFCEATPDMKPAFGKIAENVYYIGGFNGYGAEVGPGLASILVNEIINKKDSDEFREYKLERFNNFSDDFEIDKEPHEL